MRRAVSIAAAAALAGCSGGSPQIEVDRPVAGFDEPVRIRVTGAEAGSQLQLSARAVDADGTRWASVNRFTADGEGTVDLARAEPVRGIYDAADLTTG